jgi:hypothetical protein
MGHKVRRLRQRLGLTQVEMARRLGLSASYLNLIEHDQRPLTAKLVARFSRIPEVDARVLSDDDGGDLTAELAEILADPVLTASTVDPAEIAAAVAASPALGQAFLRLYNAYRLQRDEASQLGEALRQREHLANLNYEFRTLVTSIRSFAEILADNPDLDLEQRRRFLGIVVEDSKRLVPLFGDLLAAYAEGAPPATDQRPAAEDVADFLHANGGYFAELEAAAEEIRRTAGLDASVDLDRLAGLLTRGLEATETLPSGARLFAAARRLAVERCGDVVARCVEAARWASPEARSAALAALTDYVASAVLMPYDGFLAAARETRHDIERLQRRFGVDFERACRRLTTLQRPGARGVPFYIVKLDMAGNVTSRLGSPGFRVPRHGGTCPLWNVHAAFLAPGVTRAQLSRMPEGTTYFSIARTVRSEQPEVPGSPRFSAIELGCEVSFAPAIVYADGLDLSSRAAAVPIGSTCRLCDRPSCAQRVLPPFRQRAKMDIEDSAPVAG